MLLYFIHVVSVYITNKLKKKKSLNFGQIGPLPTELAALERLKNFL